VSSTTNGPQPKAEEKQRTVTRDSLLCYRVTSAGLEELNAPAGSLDDVSGWLPRGVYTTFRTFEGGRVLRLNEHLDRLDESARLLGQGPPPDHQALRRATGTALRRSGWPLARVRLTVASDPPGATYVTLTPFAEPSPERYKRGVRVITVRSLTRQTPRAKSTGFVDAGARARAAAPAGTEEALLVDADGRVLEGTSSNFFGVLSGRLRTAGEGVLEGITRSLVLELAAEALPVDLTPVMVGDLGRLDEAFITSASRAVLPVVEIDGQPVGTGHPGPVSELIGRRYRARLDDELEPLTLQEDDA